MTVSVIPSIAHPVPLRRPLREQDEHWLIVLRENRVQVRNSILTELASRHPCSWRRIRKLNALADDISGQIAALEAGR